MDSLNAITIFVASFMCFPPPLHFRSRMLLASAVVVWEWLNEHGRWRPYSPAVCHHIEAVIRSDPRCGSVVLGQVDSRLSPYIIDLHSMHQFRQDTGEIEEEERRQWRCRSGGWPTLETHFYCSCVLIQGFMMVLLQNSVSFWWCFAVGFLSFCSSVSPLALDNIPFG